MSHFTVMVVCPADITELNVHNCLDNALAPFFEQVEIPDGHIVVVVDCHI